MRVYECVGGQGTRDCAGARLQTVNQQGMLGRYLWACSPNGLMASALSCCCRRWCCCMRQGAGPTITPPLPLAILPLQQATHPRLLLLRVLAEVKVPDPPVADGGPQLEGAAQEQLEQGARGGVPLVHLRGHHRVPGSVLHQPVEGTHNRWSRREGGEGTMSKRIGSGDRLSAKLVAGS
jgi:hypothetical protein